MATVTTNENFVRDFRDLDLSFNIHPVRKDVNVHKSERAVINSIKNLVLTNHYERPFQPELGSNIRRLLFENVDSVMAAQIEREIEETIENFEPRAQVSKVTAIAAPDENKYEVVMEFFVIHSLDLRSQKRGFVDFCS